MINMTDFEALFNIILDCQLDSLPKQEYLQKRVLKIAKEKGLIELSYLEKANEINIELDKLCDELHDWIHEDTSQETSLAKEIKLKISDMAYCYKNYIEENNHE